MNPHGLSVLEFPRVIDIVAGLPFDELARLTGVPLRDGVTVKNAA